MSEAASGPTMLGVPNFSEGRNERVVRALEATLAARARMLNCHFDAAHHRCVFTLAGSSADLLGASVEGARQAIELIDLRRHQGLHPHIGALDVCPVVWIRDQDREAALAAARDVAAGVAGLGVPVFLYGELAADSERRERAFFRRGGPAELARRIKSGELVPDLGPAEPHPSAGATLVTARRPLVAFNLLLDTPNPEIAREVASRLRESGGGLPGVRALGLPWEGDRCQVSINVHDARQVPLAQVVEEVRRLAAEHGARPVEAELIGLAPAAALEGYPEEPPIRDFDPSQHLIERVLGESA